MDKKEKCDYYMDQFLGMERNERLPFKMTWHFLTCKKCRTQVRMLTRADKACRKSIKQQTSVNNPTIDSILHAVNLNKNDRTKNKIVSFIPWGIGGFITCAALMCYVLNQTNTRTVLSLSFYLVFAGTVIGYCIAFILGNIDFFIKKLDKIQNVTE